MVMAAGSGGPGPVDSASLAPPQKHRRVKSPPFFLRVSEAQEEKKRTIIYAEGEKESARMIGDAIKANPGFVELRKISVAKDISNLLAKSANRMVLNTEGLLMNLGIENEDKTAKRK